MANGRPHGDPEVSSLSMSGLLVLLVGGGLQLAYWKFFGLTVNFTRFERLGFVGLTSFLVLWGIKQILDSRRPARRGASQRAGTAEANGRRSGNHAWSISWIGIVLILVGIELLLTFRARVPSGPPELVVTLFGLLSIVFGARNILTTLLPRRYTQRPKYRVLLPKPGVIYLLVMMVLLLGSLMGRSNMLMLVFALMVGPFVLNGWITYSMLKRTRLTRRMPETAIAGEPFTVELSVANRKLLMASTVMLATDQIENDSEELQGHVMFPRVPARSTRTDAFRICLMRRGRYWFGPLHLATRFPLGIVERRLIFPDYDELLVYPRIGRLTDAWRRGRATTAEVVDRRTPVHGSFHDEFHGMREYRPGDSPRSIHWRTSVRRNQLTVREYQENRSQNLTVLIDLWSPADIQETDRERIELALSFAATLAVDHMQHARDARLDVIVAGREFGRWEGRTGPSGIDSLLSMLALAEPDAAPDVAQLMQAAEQHRSSSTRVLLLSTRGDRSAVSAAVSKSAADGTGGPRMGHLDYLMTGPEELAPFFVIPSIDVGGGAPGENGEAAETAEPAESIDAGK